MIKNNKGFMLAEVVITSTIVLTSLVGLYATFNRLYSLHKVRETYYNIDGMYAIKGVIDEMISSSNYNLNTVLSGVTDANPVSLTSNEISNYIDGYKIKNMYVTNYNTIALDKLKTNVTNQTFKDYIDFVGKRYNFTDGSYEYLVLIEYGSDNIDDLYYSSMGIG